MQILDLVALLVFTYGAIVYSAMLVAWASASASAARRGAWQSADTVGIAMGILSTAWFVFHAASVVWPEGAWTPAERLLAISLSITMSYAYPPLIMHVTWVQLDAARRTSLPVVVRGALPLMYLVSAAAIVATVAALWGQTGSARLTTDVVEGMVAAMFIACGLWSAFVTMRAGRASESVQQARMQRVYAVLFLGMAVAFGLMWLAWQTLLIGRAVDILVRSLPLVFLFAGTWVEDRFAFYDIFLKRGLTLFVALFVVAGWSALVLPWLDVLGAGWWRPWAFSLAMLPMAVILPALARYGEAWLDRAWFGRPVSTVDAIAQVLDAADGARDEADLRTRLAGAFTAAVNIPVRIDAWPDDTDDFRVGRRDAGAAAQALRTGSSTAGGRGGRGDRPVDLSQRHGRAGERGMPRGECEHGDPAPPALLVDLHVTTGCRMVAGASAGVSAAEGLSVAIDGGAGSVWRVTVEAGDASRPLLSEDVARVQTLARVAGPLVRAMRGQQTVRDHELRTQQLALDARRAELRALRAQIDPHFLFNALNAVAGLVHVDAERADRAVEALAEVFRYTLRASEREWARVDDELAFAQAYLAVEVSRFGDARLAVSVACDPAVASAQVPALVVQTLVENAIKHGVAQTRARAEVVVRAYADGDTVVVCVENDGPAPPASALGSRNVGEGDERVPRPGRGPARDAASADVPGDRVEAGEGHGLRNVRARLDGYYGAAASLVLERDALTRAVLRVPRDPRHGVRPSSSAVSLTTTPG